MATFDAIAAVSRTLRLLLLDRLETQNAEVTLAPPDVSLPTTARRVNLYLYQVLENTALRNQDLPGRVHPGSRGHPPLSLNLRYLLSTYSASEETADADTNAQALLGDAMRVLHEWGVQPRDLKMTRGVGGKAVGDPLVDPTLANEYEQLKVVLHPSAIDDLTRLWSAMPQANFRRSVIYEATVVQIETLTPRVRAQPVRTRVISTAIRHPPTVLAAALKPEPGTPGGDIRVSIGATVVVETQGASGAPAALILGEAEPTPLPHSADGSFEIVIPDDPRLQPGPLPLRIVVEAEVGTVSGGLDRGATGKEEKSLVSNVALLQLAPKLATLAVLAGPRLRLDGTRLWHQGAGLVEVVVGDRSARITRAPGTPPADPPLPTRLEVPVADFALGSPGDYAVSVLVDGVRSVGPELVYQHV